MPMDMVPQFMGYYRLDLGMLKIFEQTIGQKDTARLSPTCKISVGAHQLARLFRFLQKKMLNICLVGFTKCVKHIYKALIGQGRAFDTAKSIQGREIGLKGCNACE